MWPSMENLFEDIGRPLHALSPAPLEYIYLLCTTMWNVDGSFEKGLGLGLSLSSKIHCHSCSLSAPFPVVTLGS